MRYLMIFVALLINGCTTTLRIDKPIQLDNNYATSNNMEIMDNKLAERFNDKRRYIFKALINTPCFLEVNSKYWINLLMVYGKDDIDGFIEWVTNGALYSNSGGQFLKKYFEQVKLTYEVTHEE
jgi:hypothetical protein